MTTIRESMALMSVSPSLLGITTAACHREHRSSIWKMMYLWTKRRSHSTCWLNFSASSVLLTLAGPGRAHSRHTGQLCTTSGSMSRTLSATPTRSRKRRIMSSEACHQRTCSFRSVCLIAVSLLVRKIRTHRPMSKLVQSAGLSVLVPSSRYVLRSRCSRSGPLPD